MIDEQGGMPGLADSSSASGMHTGEPGLVAPSSATSGFRDERTTLGRQGKRLVTGSTPAAKRVPR